MVKAYKHRGHSLSKHSFVVLSNESGTIAGLDYDFVCNVLSSFKNEQQKEKKLDYPGNFAIYSGDSSVARGNTKDGYVKAEQLYYFNNAKIEYSIIGRMHADVFNRLVDFIENLNAPLEHIIDNL